MSFRISAAFLGGIFFICLFFLPVLAQDDTIPSYEIVVTARRTEEATQTSTVSVITRDAFEGRNTTLSELVDKQAGLKVNKMGGLGEYSTVSVRGSTAEQVKVYLDGVLVNDPMGGGVDLSKIPLTNVERIEVFKGSIPAKFQGNGTAGVINIVTRETGKGVLTGQVTGGSFGTRKAGGMVSGKTGNRAYMGSFDYQHSNNDYQWLDNNGTTSGTLIDPTLDDTLRTMLNNDFTSYNGMLKGEWRPESASCLRAEAEMYQYNKGYFFTRMNPSARPRAAGYRSGLQINALREGQSYAAEIYAHGKVSGQHVTNPDGAIYWYPKDFSSVIYEWESGGNVRFAPYPWNSLTLYANGLYEAYSEETASFAARPDANRKTAIGTLSDQLFLFSDRLLVSGSYTLDGRFLHSQATADQMSEKNAVPQYLRRFYRNWNLGVKAGPFAKGVIKANVGRYTRVPNFSELFGNNAYFRGSPELQPEIGLNTDLSLEYKAEVGPGISLEGTCTGFYNLLQDQIVFRMLSQGALKPMNMGDIRISGLEQKAVVKWRMFSLENQFVYMRSRIYRLDIDTSEYIGKERAYLPNVKDILAIKVENSRFSFEYDLNYRSDYYKSEANLSLLPSALTHDLSLAIFPPSQWMRLTLEIKNLADATNYDYEAFPLPGRAIYATFQFHHLFKERTEK
ncbi:MAG: TonB-dependent receptor plug domain-containing protein [Fibrobacterota bacterium]